MTEVEIRRELWRVRKKLNDADGAAEDWMYGAQQALGWVLGELRPPHELADIVDVVMEELVRNGPADQPSS